MLSWGRGYYPGREGTCEKSQCQNPTSNQFNQVSEGCSVDTTTFKSCQMTLMSRHCEGQMEKQVQTRVCLKSFPEHTDGPVCGSLPQRIAVQYKRTVRSQTTRWPQREAVSLISWSNIPPLSPSCLRVFLNSKNIWCQFF